VQAVEAAVATHTAGSPVDKNMVWTNRSPRQIAEEVAAEGFSVCADTVRRILTEDLELGLRQAEKEVAGKTCAFREEQFEHIARRRKWYERRGWPVLSLDTKKKELLGDFFRPGRAYTDGVVRVLDHDFATHASGLLLLCDCGGSNGNRQHRFKEDLADLAYKLRRPIEVAHYPPGCSKFNPIERRMFCHVTRILQGVVLRSIQVARDFMARTTTASGLKVIVEVARHTYERGRKATAEFLNEMPIRCGKLLPQFNYTARA